MTDAAVEHRDAARFFGVADTLRRRMGSVRFVVHDVTYLTSVTCIREALGENAFRSAWEEGAAMSPNAKGDTLMPNAAAGNASDPRVAGVG